MTLKDRSGYLGQQSANDEARTSAAGMFGAIIGFVIGLALGAPVFCVTEQGGNEHFRRCDGLVLWPSSWIKALMLGAVVAVLLGLAAAALARRKIRSGQEGTGGA